MVLRTMLTMLSDLGMSITAEGIEQDAQLDWLLKHGVTKGQGFLFDKPLSLTEAVGRLRSMHYRPKAIPVEPGRVWAARRRRLVRKVWTQPWNQLLGRGGRRRNVN